MIEKVKIGWKFKENKMSDKKYCVKVYGLVHILPRVDYNYDNICCEQLKIAVQNNAITINLAANKFYIKPDRGDGFHITNCPFCLAELEVIQTDKFVDNDDKETIWKKQGE